MLLLDPFARSLPPPHTHSVPCYITVDSYLECAASNECRLPRALAITVLYYNKLNFEAARKDLRTYCAAPGMAIAQTSGPGAMPE